MKWWPRIRNEAPRVSRTEPTLGLDRQALKITPMALDALQTRGSQPFRVAQPMPGVVPPEELKLAMDGVSNLYSYAAINASGDMLSFPGFPLLAELAQRPEYRHISETIAREMTRKWVRLIANGDDDKSDKIAALEARMEELDVRGVFRRACEHDGLFGRGHVYIETDGGRDRDALRNPLVVDRATVPQGTNIRLRNVEPLWTYPNDYNSADPLNADFYKPRTWWVMGTPVHRTRLLSLIGREMPDILKPAYGFAGLSLSQMAIPYVQNWLRTRQSVSDLLHSFSVMVLATNMSAVLQGGGSESLVYRAQMFNQTRDNRGLMMLDKETETLANVSAPLSTLDHLQAQAQEQMASVSGIPLVKLLGITPTGLNASSDGEIRVFYDTIAAYQIKLFGDPLKRVMDLLQLSLFGEVDPEIGFEFEPLWQLDEAGEAAVRKTDADTDIEYVNAGVLAPEEVRNRIAHAKGSAYSNIDVSDVPEPEDDGGGEITDPETNRIEEKAENEGGATSGV